MFSLQLIVLLATAAILAKSTPIDLNEITTDNRIYNGKPSARGQFPFYVYLKMRFADGRLGSCGGNLISDQWVMTAGHCVEPSVAAEVHLGALALKDENEKGRLRVYSRVLHLHPGYKFDPSIGTFDDVGLIKLPEPIKFSETIQPVKLPTSCASNEDLEAVAIGNGIRSSHENQLAPILQWAPLSTITLEKCKEIYTRLTPKNTVICAVGREEQSTCAGDSGGPLVRKNDTVLIGLTSFGLAMGCDLGYPTAFTDVTRHFKWISEISGLKMPNC